MMASTMMSLTPTIHSHIITMLIQNKLIGQNPENYFQSKILKFQKKMTQHFLK